MDFKEAYNLPIGENVEKKGRFSYLSWAYAVKFLRVNFPEATWTVEQDENKAPYFETPTGCFVAVTVFVNNRGYTQWHPVLDNKNNTIKQPNAFQINTSIQRCLAKAIGIATGIGLGLYAGEDLPVEETPPKKTITTITPDQAILIKDLCAELEFGEEQITKMLAWNKLSYQPKNTSMIAKQDYELIIGFLEGKMKEKQGGADGN